MKNFDIKKLFLLVLISFCFTRVDATHNRAGEITYVQISDLTYEITITTFTYTLSFADRPTLDVDWGDNTISTAPRDVPVVYLPNYYKKNVYHKTHTFPGPGVYKIVVQDPNRNANVKNIPNSVNVIFSISTILTVNPAIGHDDTPVLLNPPYDKAAYHKLFIHNPAAYDPDGDSLSYRLTICTREDAKPIVGYSYPPATSSFRVDSISGDLIWSTPADTGKYNVAMLIEEWRNSKKIGAVERDMQIEVYDTKNNPPVNGPLKDYCVQAGDTVKFLVTATDPDKDYISLKASSGIFSLSTCAAAFTKKDSTAGYASSQFYWIPCFESVRKQPYNIIVKSEDNNSDIKLFDIDHMNITVLGPQPHLINAIPQGKTINLTWSDYGTTAISGFNIYRREGASTFKPDSCTAGIPSSFGFVKVGYIAGSSTKSYGDNNNGSGLEYGKEYTYRIVAVYYNGTESKASNEITSTLISGIPFIRNVSVRVTDTINGSIYLAWAKPLRLDTIKTISAITGPYQYIISRAKGVGGTDYQTIKTIDTPDLNDTVYVDTLINTSATGYIYRIDLYNNAVNNRFLISDPSYASSIYLTAAPGDRKARFTINRNVPWINSRYDFYRLNDVTNIYDSVGSTNQLTYIDYGLINGKKYHYFVKSTGDYLPINLPKNLVNYSEITFTTPVDNEAPCAPTLLVTTKCDSLYNYLSWSVSDTACFSDIAGYKIYYKPTASENLSLIRTINDKNNVTFKHYPGESIAACYTVSAFDAAGNESAQSTMVCKDSCNYYEIPNVFTPNGDGFNDKLVAKTSGLVQKVDFKLFNRGGLLLFKTEEPKIEWDGTYKGKIVSPGVYFYQCDVYENGTSGIKMRRLSGFVHVITEKGAKVNTEATK